MTKYNNGIHHITAIAGDPQVNLDFYAGLLGLRLVKKTVNFDDPSVYHLYYGDKTGSPGTILTFFPWERAAQGHPDRGQVVAIGFSIPTESLEYWKKRLVEYEIGFESEFKRFGKNMIGLQDPDGLHIELVADPKSNEADGWEGGPVPNEHTIRGIYGASLAVEEAGPTADLLEDTLGFSSAGQEDDRYLYQTDATFGSVIEIIEHFKLSGRSGKGTVHHIAYRAEDETHQLQIRQKLLDIGYHVTDIKNRNYFKSIYFHEAAGILFEVATDPPGFTADEDLKQLGTGLKLPSWLEKKRNLVESNLPKLVIPQ